MNASVKSEVANANRLPLSGQTTDSQTASEPMAQRIAEAQPGSVDGGRSLPAGAESTLTDKEAVRIAIRQFSLEELKHEEEVISRQLAILHGVLADIRRERKYRRSMRG
jgi:phage tail protein X